MYRDFAVKTTSDYHSQYKPKTLVGNWYEQRCDPQKIQNYHFYKQRKFEQQKKNPILTEDNFQQTTSNWLNFQNYNPNSTFKTQYRQNYLKAQQQKRLSKLNPFITKKSEFDRNPDALDQYRNKWTKSQHAFQYSRTALGHTKH